MTDELLRAPRYQFSEVSRLLGLAPSTLRRWALGYEENRRGQLIKHPPVIQPPSEGYLSFLDLVDLYFVGELMRHKVPFCEIRNNYRALAELKRQDHPFARESSFQVLSRRILAYHAFGDEKAQPVHPPSGQIWIDKVVVELGQKVEFDADLACRWWPLGPERHVVLDPKLGFGAPTVAGRGLKTWNVYDLFVAEGRDIAVVLDWFDIDEAAARDAIAFEERNLQKAA